MAWQTGLKIGQYEVVSEIGAGGMATVYKAYQPSKDRFVALKAMHPNFRDEESFVIRFKREAEIVSKLEHDNIVPMYDFAEHEKQPYIVMKFIDGETLKDRLGRGLPNVDEILRIMNQIADALTYAHMEGILHRDVKPSNIMLATDGTAYLTDFGLARVEKVGQSTLSADVVLGTPHYLSPEQAKGSKEIDGRADVYSFGVVLYELFVGRVPFNADSYYSILNDHINTPLPEPFDVNPEIPKDISDVITKAMSKKPHHRYDNALQAMQDIRMAIAQSRLSRLNSDRASIADISLARIRKEFEETEALGENSKIQKTNNTTPILNKVDQPSTQTVTKATLMSDETNRYKKFWLYGGLTTFILATLGWVALYIGSLSDLSRLQAYLAENVPESSFEVFIGDRPFSGFAQIPELALLNFTNLNVAQAQDLIANNRDSLNTDVNYLYLANAYWQVEENQLAYQAVADGYKQIEIDNTERQLSYIYSASVLAQRNDDFNAQAAYLLMFAYGFEINTDVTADDRAELGEMLYDLAETVSLQNKIDEIMINTGLLSRPELTTITQSNFVIFFEARVAIVNNRVFLATRALNRISEEYRTSPEIALLRAEIELTQDNIDQALQILTSLVQDTSIPEWIQERANEFIEENS
jgi:serine/threonine protein kinase